jgi:hypothetical protein
VFRTVSPVCMTNGSVDWLINEFKVESIIFIIVVINTSKKMLYISEVSRFGLCLKLSHCIGVCCIYM